MAAQYELLKELLNSGTKLNFGQESFFKFYQAFLLKDRWMQYIQGVGTTLLVTAMALALGIAIQNLPEGAIISMPLRAEGEGKGKAFFGGVLSGVVEPIGAVLTILAAQLVIPALPYFLSFAAGAMLYVVVEELSPEMAQGKHSNIGTICFAAGFSVMMVLDVALG